MSRHKLHTSETTVSKLLARLSQIENKTNSQFDNGGKYSFVLILFKTENKVPSYAYQFGVHDLHRFAG